MVAGILVALLIACGGEATELPPTKDNTEPTATKAGPATPVPTPTLKPTATPRPTAKPFPPSPTPDPTPTSGCRAPDDADATALLRELQSCKPDLSQHSRELIRFFLELQEFKTDPEFLTFGFGVCCQFNDWLKETEALRDKAGLSTFSEIGFLPGDLFTLGMEYIGSAGQPTEFTEFLEADITIATRKTMGLVKALATPTANQALSVETIGEWRNEYIWESRLVIVNEAGQFRLEETFDDGGTFQEALVESESQLGRRFDLIERSGEYLIIDRLGNLQLWDRYGLVSTAKNLE